MSLSDEFQKVQDKISKANSKCKFILEGIRMIPIEYIQSSGTQYIDTGIKASSKISVEMVASATTSNSQGYFIGGQNSGDSNRYGFRSWSDGYMYFYTASSGWPSAYVNMTGKHTYKTDKYVLYVDGTKKITANSATFTSSYNMYLFANNRTGSAEYYLSGKMYYCKIWENNVLVRDFVPMKDSNNVAGMYDNITGTFFYNKGSGSFTAGPEI